MMPHRFTALLLLPLLLFTACTDSREERQQLEELERQNRADSVMNDLALAQSLADHFDRHGTSNEQLRAHYILGRTHADRGELPQAVAAYNDAADRADTTVADCDYRTLSRVHAQLAQLYYSQLLPDNMIREERRAMRYAKMANDTMQYLYCYGMLAEGYEMKILPDSALLILSDAYSLYKQSGHEKQAASLCCSIADICRRQKKYELADYYMKKFETLSGYFEEEGNIMSGKEMYYSCKGHLCLDTSDKNNAEHYFRKLLGVAYNYDLKIAALGGLQQFYTNYFNKDSLVKYNHLRDSLCNIVHTEVEMQKTIQAQALYDYTHSELIASQKSREADQLRNVLIIVVLFCVIILLISVIAYIRHRDEKQRLRDRIQLLRGNAVNKNLYDSPIAQHFRELLKANPYQNPSLSDWKELKTAISQEIPDFQEKLQTDSCQLSDNEYDICLLIKIQTSCSDIARLKQCTPSYVTQIRKNVYQRLFNKAGKADDLDEYIMSLS